MTYEEIGRRAHTLYLARRETARHTDCTEYEPTPGMDDFGDDWDDGTPPCRKLYDWGRLEICDMCDTCKRHRVAKMAQVQASKALTSANRAMLKQKERSAP